MLSNVKKLLLAGFGLLGAAAPSYAGWNHLAEVVCNDGPIRRAFKPASDCEQPAPAKTKVEYETRTYYEPITVMKPERIQEPVEVKVKSYYWEPVESYSYRSYYDPCSCQTQQIAVPRTSYVRKEEVRSETRYLEKVRMVPVQVEREITETRPVYTYYGPTTRKVGPTTSGPTVDQFHSNPGISNEPRGGYDPIKNPGVPAAPFQSMPKKEIPKIDAKKPTVDTRFNALSTSATKVSPTKVYGEVLASDSKTPLTNAKLVFVNAANFDEKVYVSADGFGGFDATLPTAGEWHVYAGPGKGKADYIAKFNAKEGERLELGVVAK